ncbi:response regulator transcription factor [Derxia gummosa]|uniref:Response regulator transcription factor n=1 Tax=Derxia gummosa DSM 723 TaxID=1121388 RepID=A0A8B6X8Q7_9BURK|nr:response regulator transcription factor [Derxia gummosa]
MLATPLRSSAPATTTQPPTVFIVDDDEAVRDSLAWLLEANTYRVQAFESAEAFLESYEPMKIGVLLLDVRMPGMSGLELQERLNAMGNGNRFFLPIIFITGHGDVPMAVSTMKKGAVDFVEKPFNESELRAIVERMLTQAQTVAADNVRKRAAEEKLSRLTLRERQVLDCIVAGRLNKQIADDLSISIKTVEAHRANVMEKLGVANVADLLKLALSQR